MHADLPPIAHIADLCAGFEASPLNVEILPRFELAELCLGQFDVVSLLPIWLLTDIEFEVSDICPTPIADLSGATMPAALTQCLDGELNDAKPLESRTYTPSRFSLSRIRSRGRHCTKRI